MKSDVKITLGIVIFLVAAIIISVPFGDYSIIGQGVSEQCILEDGTCVMELTLPEYRSLDSYNLDLEFASVAGAYKEVQQVTAVAYDGPRYYESDMEESTSYEDLETNHLYMYRIPSDWDMNDDIYSIKMHAVTNAWVKSTNTNAQVYLDIDMGYIDYPYVTNSVKTCGEDNYDREVCIVRSYDKDYSNDPNEMRYSVYNDIYFGKRMYDLDLDTGDSDYKAFFGTQMFSTLETEGELIFSDIIETTGVTNPQTELMFFVLLNADEEDKGFVDWGITIPPQVTLSYASEEKPTNVKIAIGNSIVQTIMGQPDKVQTQDLAQAINTYCSGVPVGSECIVPITLTSSEGGIINAVSETGTLRALDANGQATNNVTGFTIADSFDFENNPTQAYITTGILVAILGVGIIFVPWGKKK